ncbi:caspase family protein [Okeania sp. SIO1I7]|uniref:caspase family protein n=1 Tax=Okeania sp. SIO1I7 TaxID=2607772 RepID=UPI0013F7ADEF|nr:caspase family protein [Okeania sp. SIO1I7]NET26720.1 caspase family protein [Okeania sp. SIO1I7]
MNLTTSKNWSIFSVRAVLTTVIHQLRLLITPKENPSLTTNIWHSETPRASDRPPGREDAGGRGSTSRDSDRPPGRGDAGGRGSTSRDLDRPKDRDDAGGRGETLKQTPNFHALLIGIDFYFPHKLSDGSYYKSLGGCVRDINHVEAFLKNRLQVPQTQILKLTASNVEGSTKPSEPKELWPTYENMVAKFKEITEKAQPQDQVYIHYSGHGGRAPTTSPELKGEDGIDQSLVPTDIGNPETRYLRDLELARLLENMVDKGLVVTVALDSCHSGGAARNIGDDCDIRRSETGVVDTTPRPTDSLVASEDELAQTWESLAQNNQNTRNITSSGWLPEPKGYTLLAACRENESAYETDFDGERHGALTYWMLRSLEKFGTGVSAKTLHNRVFAKVHTQFEKQTPMLQGESDRSFFGNNLVSPQFTVPVIQVDLEENQVQLNAGQAHGLRKGAEFAIYPLGTADFTQTNQRLALVKITQRGAVNSWATITQMLGENKIEDIEDGAPALLLSPSVKLVRKIRLLSPEEQNQPSGIDYKVALQAIESAMPEGKGWVELVSGDETADYQVSINKLGEYEILDRAGIPIANLRPALEVSNPNAAISVVKRLVHLSKYHANIDLDNHDPMSPLKGKIEVELFRLPDDFEPGDPEEFIRFNDSGNVPTLDVGQFAYLYIRNKSSLPLNITVLAIQPDWSIKKLYPTGVAFQTVGSGKEVKWRIKTSLPNGYQEGTDILKVFATIDGTSFDWLELPALDKPIQPKNAGKATTPLAKFLAKFLASEEAPPTKNVNSAAYASEEWTTEQITLVVKKGFNNG